MSTAIKLRGDSTVNWTSNNPVLLDREIAVDTTLNRFKIGNGTSTWSQLNFMDKSLEDALGLKVPINNPTFTGTVTLPSTTPTAGSYEAATTKYVDEAIDSVGSGTNYLMVYGTGTPTENAAELQAAYDAAKLMLPTTTNTITVVVAPGVYTFGATKFTANTSYIDIVSLTGNVDVKLDGINVTANYAYLKGINTGVTAFTITGTNVITSNCIGLNFASKTTVEDGVSDGDAVNKGQLDLKEDKYVPYLNAVGSIANAPSRQLHVFTSNTDFELSINGEQPIGTIIIFKKIGNPTVNILNVGTATIDGQDVDVSTLGTSYALSGAYGKVTLYKYSSTAWLII